MNDTSISLLILAIVAISITAMFFYNSKQYTQNNTNSNNPTQKISDKQDINLK
jgi:hypothetical protein